MASKRLRKKRGKATGKQGQIRKVKSRIRKLRRKGINVPDIDYDKMSEKALRNLKPRKIKDLKGVKSEKPVSYGSDSLFINMSLSYWFNTAKKFSNGALYPVLIAWANTIIKEQGKEAFAEMIERGANEGLLLSYEVFYKDAVGTRYMAEMTRLIPDTGIMYQGEIMDRVEFAKNISDLMEQEEDWTLPEME